MQCPTTAGEHCIWGPLRTSGNPPSPPRDPEVQIPSPKSSRYPITGTGREVQARPFEEIPGRRGPGCRHCPSVGEERGGASWCHLWAAQDRVGQTRNLSPLGSGNLKGASRQRLGRSLVLPHPGPALRPRPSRPPLAGSPLPLSPPCPPHPLSPPSPSPSAGRGNLFPPCPSPFLRSGSSVQSPNPNPAPPRLRPQPRPPVSRRGPGPPSPAISFPGPRPLAPGSFSPPPTPPPRSFLGPRRPAGQNAESRRPAGCGWRWRSPRGARSERRSGGTSADSRWRRR